MQKSDTADKQNQVVRDALTAVLKHRDIQTHFQPIISLRDGTVFGYEALSYAPVDSILHVPDALFAAAETYEMLWELEMLCQEKALEALDHFPQELRLFLNLSPSVIHAPAFKEGFTLSRLKQFGLLPENVHFEITERSAIRDFDGFCRMIENCKRQHYQIVIDNAGAGYSGLNLIADIHPQYIKLDSKLIRHIHRDYYRQAMVKSFYEFCRLTDVLLIADGVESGAELDALIDIGVHYGQGSFIQRPAPRIEEISPDIMEAIHSRNEKKNHTGCYFLTNTHIGNLCCRSKAVPPDMLCEKVRQFFVKESALLGITVVDRGQVKGLVTKTHFDHMMSGQYGFSLYSHRPISIIMDQNPLIVDYQTPVDVVSKMAMSRPANRLYDCIVVTDQGQYAGVVTIKALLEKVLEIEVSHARHQNPLTGLPGNMLIEQHLSDCIVSGEPFAVLYMDLDNFKAYNDVYGFEKGDRVIAMVARLMEEFVPGEAFVGHVGGDDFIIALKSHAVETLCKRLIDSFDARVRAFYTEEDLQKGFIVAKNRRGEVEQFPLMSLSIACVTNKGNSIRDVFHLAERAGVLKKKCKQKWVSSYIVD